MQDQIQTSVSGEAPFLERLQTMLQSQDSGKCSETILAQVESPSQTAPLSQALETPCPQGQSPPPAQYSTCYSQAHRGKPRPQSALPTSASSKTLQGVRELSVAAHLLQESKMPSSTLAITKGLAEELEDCLLELLLGSSAKEAGHPETPMSPSAQLPPALQHHPAAPPGARACRAEIDSSLRTHKYPKPPHSLQQSG